MRTHGVNQAFRFVEGIWLHRKSHQIRFFFGKRPCFHHSCATWNEQPSSIKPWSVTHSQSHGCKRLSILAYYYIFLNFLICELPHCYGQFVHVTIEFSTSAFWNNGTGFPRISPICNSDVAWCHRYIRNKINSAQGYCHSWYSVQNDYWIGLQMVVLSRRVTNFRKTF